MVVDGRLVHDLTDMSPIMTDETSKGNGIKKKMNGYYKSSFFKKRQGECSRDKVEFIQHLPSSIKNVNALL